MKRRFACLLLFFLVIALVQPVPAQVRQQHSGQAQEPASKSRFNAYSGLIMAGYQGWFRAEGDGTKAKRYAYGNEERSGIDMWPDVS